MTKKINILTCCGRKWTGKDDQLVFIQDEEAPSLLAGECLTCGNKEFDSGQARADTQAEEAEPMVSPEPALENEKREDIDYEALGNITWPEYKQTMELDEELLAKE